MIPLYSLVAALSGAPLALQLPLSTLVRYIRLATAIQPVILHRLPPDWQPQDTPAALPEYALSFLGHRIGITEECAQQLWASLGFWIWSMGESMLDGQKEEEEEEDQWDAGVYGTMLSENMLYPETRICTNPQCVGHGSLLRMWDVPSPVQVFTLTRGAYDTYLVHLTCKDCNALYYPNYVVREDTRQYYAGIPEYIQVSGHKYIERAVLEHFTTLSVLSWTSATNAAHIYHTSMAKLQGSDLEEPRFRLRPSHTWDGFVLLALLRDIEDHGGVLEVPHTCNQKDRFTEAMQRRNEQIRRSGQPEWAHWCTKCVRRFDDPDGVTRFVDCVITDGIDMGRPCCAYPHCANPLRSTQEHWCHEHRGYKCLCVVDGCRAMRREGHRTCPLHAGIEDHYVATGKAMFTLRKRLQRAQVAHPTDALDPHAPIDEEVDIPGPCPEKPSDGNVRVRARFGRRRTHNEQVIVRPCGIITARETFYGSETVPRVLEMLKKRHLIPGSVPKYVHYDNNCSLYKHAAATPGEDFQERVGLPVDVFHWTCKHKKTDIECSFHCNPHTFPELLKDDHGWFFNSSRAEQTNVWLGGYHAIIREMGAVKYEFFLDEMILQKNKLTKAKLEAEDCLPGYRTDLRFNANATTV